MTRDLPWWGLALLTAVCAAVVAAVAYDMRRRLPRKITTVRLIAEAEQACWDHDFRTITDHMEQQ